MSSSAADSLWLRKQVARIDQAIEDSAEQRAATNGFMAEQARLLAEQTKLLAEVPQRPHERLLAPALALIVTLAAIAGVASLVPPTWLGHC